MAGLSEGPMNARTPSFINAKTHLKRKIIAVRQRLMTHLVPQTAAKEKASMARYGGSIKKYSIKVEKKCTNKWR